MSESAVGRPVSELETPVAVVDLDKLERNLARASSYAAEHGLALWPHLKTHKTLEIARRQLDAGATGLTVAKSSEAAIFADRGIGPLLLHYPVVGAAKVERVVAVAERQPLTIAVDSLEAAEPLAAALARRGVSAECLVELDVGMERTGVTPDAALSLARAIDALDGGLSVAGLSCYPGHLRGDAIDAGVEQVGGLIGAARAAFDAAGLRCDRVSGGSTPTLFASHRTGVSEIRPGNYVFLDRAEATGDAYSLADCALTVHATVVSTSVPGRVIFDAGSKELSEAASPLVSGSAAVAGRPEIAVVALNEEHAWGELAAAAPAPAVGDRVELIPNHACTCVNLHDVLYGARAGVVEEQWAVIARGATR